MNRTTRRLVIAGIVVLLIGAVATVTVASTGLGPGSSSESAHQTLVVSDAETGESLIETPVEDGSNVTLAFTHSVEKTPVRDIYTVNGTTLYLDHAVFHSHGAGLPTGSSIETTDEGFVFPTNRSTDELVVQPGSIAGHELIVDGTRYDLVARSDGAVVVSVTDRPDWRRTIDDIL